MSNLADLPPEVMTMVLEHLVSDIPGYWGTFTDINNFLRASRYSLQVARIVYFGMCNGTDDSDDFAERSKGWKWKVATSFVMVDAEMKRRSEKRDTDNEQRQPTKPHIEAAYFKLDACTPRAPIESLDKRLARHVMCNEERH
ncbi:hypothetical protein PMZ80_002104 [Knufia obscura]|uniref:F-box domain-containing protein n=2 Tax=Knufia TaxID=430999 RepID=A0AAN8EER0_9EURO|nr:hypothetical protein PMZ80_002104 [Knufia obscura]KAK5953919.1 hypothetical protein OHC33_005190 [Knufia fluminis]